MIKRLKALFRPERPEDLIELYKSSPIEEKWAVGGGWGNHITFRGETQVYGHKPRRPKEGDWLCRETKKGKIALYRFVSVELERDPPDMFFGDVKFIDWIDRDIAYFNTFTEHPLADFARDMLKMGVHVDLY